MASPNSFSDSYAQDGPGDGIELTGVHQVPTQAQSDNESTSNPYLVYTQGSLPFSVVGRVSAQAQERRCEEVMSELRGVRATIEQLKEQKQKDLEHKEDQLRQMTFDRDANKTLLELKTKELELERRENKQRQSEMSEQLRQKDKELSQKDDEIKQKVEELKRKDEELSQKDKELEQKDLEISELKAQNEELEKIIVQLTKEKEHLKKTVRDMEAQMQELNQSVCEIQNQSVTMQHEVEQRVLKDELSAKMHEMEERTDRCVDEKVDKKVEEKLENVMKMKLAELMSSLAVSNTASPETAQLAAAAVAKLQTDKRLSPKAGSQTPSPSPSPINVPTPPTENEQTQ